MPAVRNSAEEPNTQSDQNTTKSSILRTIPYPSLGRVGGSTHLRKSMARLAAAPVVVATLWLRLFNTLRRRKLRSNLSKNLRSGCSPTIVVSSTPGRTAALSGHGNLLRPCPRHLHSHGWLNARQQSRSHDTTFPRPSSTACRQTPWQRSRAGLGHVSQNKHAVPSAASLGGGFHGQHLPWW